MADRTGNWRSGRLALALLLLAGLSAIGLAMVAGLLEGVLPMIARPPLFWRAGFAGFAFVLGGALLLRAIQRIGGSIDEDRPAGADISDADLGSLVRAVRLVFLSAAAFTAAGGWLLGDPLPLVIALVIAGVDIVETSFLLLVASRRAR
jgi:hypothetical protein